MSNSEPALHFGLGNDTAIRSVKVSWPSGAEQTFADLAVDRRYTITEPKVEPDLRAGFRRTVQTSLPGGQAPPQFTECASRFGLSIASQEEAIDEIATQRLLPRKLNRRGPAIAVADVTGTGRDSVVIGGTTVAPAQITRPLDLGAVGGNASTPLPLGAVDDGPVLVFDADGDGHADLLITRGGNSLPAGAPEYQPKLFVNDGHGGFRAAGDDALPALPVSAGAAVAADFDRDGRLDVFIGGRVVTGQYPQPPQSALLANRGGKFEDVTDAVAPELKFVGMVTSALWSDVDDDGWPDLLLTLEWGQVKYFHNNSGKRFEDWTDKSGFAAAGTGWWTSIAAADFNGDGRMDYVVGNAGLNTQYRADSVHPALLYSGDFKGDGSNQLIEAYYEGVKIYPWRTWRDMTAAFPALAKRYRRNDAYAPETVAAIFGQAKLDTADKYAATELRSGVLLSRTDGTYAFEPLPRLAQISPLNGIVTGDFDGDGHADIYAVQNSYAPIAAVGRFDGGLSQLLTGDGSGHFLAVPVAESGLIVPGDAKGLVAVDLDNDGWADFVVTRNNATALCFRNGGVAGRHGLRVALAAAPGNSTGIGARVTLEYADGTKAVAEVYAGSGYYSQTAAACWFGYRETNPAKRVLVRWPDGATTEQPVANGATSVVVKR
jgi:hypothetical protein